MASQVVEDPVTAQVFHYTGSYRRGLINYDSAFLHKKTGDATMPTTEEEVDAYRIGPQYLTGPQEASSLIMNLVGQTWVASFQTAAALTGYDFYFTFWPLSWVPREEEFDTTAMNALLTG